MGAHDELPAVRADAARGQIERCVSKDVTTSPTNKPHCSVVSDASVARRQVGADRACSSSA